MAGLYYRFVSAVLVRHDQRIFHDQAANAMADEKQRPRLLP